MQDKVVGRRSANGDGSVTLGRKLGHEVEGWAGPGALCLSAGGGDLSDFCWEGKTMARRDGGHQPSMHLSVSVLGSVLSSCNTQNIKKASVFRELTF